ncbi:MULTISPECIES: hypothetical protein [unclassified Clostridium]|uniref:hypothetical protein n=1 Tax=unclassified Clostridium TaxID=2614128 RepID=UPI0002984EF6|nr:MULTISPECIES: hypothetical protein [unclassified Clostridium]EKQ51583.1 MAG: hypothetical protein A370_04761 [Clostridium sp. Maddingley MBC34-26]
MNRQSFQAYREKVLLLLKILGEKDYLTIHEIETEPHKSSDISKEKINTVIPFKRIK